MVGLGNVDSTTDFNKPVSIDTAAAFADRVNATDLDKTPMGVSNVDDTSDANKPMSILASTSRNLLSLWLPRNPAPGHQVSKLTAWKTALANWGTAKAQVVVVGDSISEGSDAGIIQARWQTVLQDVLRDRLGVVEGADFPFIPTMEATSATGMPAVVEGNVTLDQNWGFGWRTGVIRDTGKLTFTFTGTSAAIMYARQGATGVMRVVVDGGAPVLVNTNSVTTGLGGSDAVLWGTGALAAGVHTVVVTRDVSSGTDQTPFVQGLLTYNGDETSGIRIIDAAHSGYRSANMDATRTRTTAKAVMAAGGASLVVIAMGTNDTLYATTQVEYKANINRMIAAMRTEGYAGSFLLIHWYKTSAETEATWAPYGQTLAEIAAADPSIAYLNMRKHMPDLPSPYTDVAGLGLFAGNLHPNATGHGWIAQTLASVLNV